MLQALLSTMRDSVSNDAALTRRNQPRRAVDRCIAVIDNTPHPIENWSLGGVRVTANERLYALGQQLDITLKFKLSDRVIDIRLNGNVIRKTNGKIAIAFDALDKQTRGQFMQVIDDDVANEFAESQAG